MALRVVAALLLLWHGVQEHFGLLVPPGETWRSGPVLFTEPWYAATIELAGGALLALGLFTRVAALVLVGLVAVAYFGARGLGRLWMPSGEELIALYCGVLLAFAVIGSGLFSLDALIARLRARSSATTVPLSPWIRRQYRRRELTR
jgi:putative oxidoreductase